MGTVGQGKKQVQGECCTSTWSTLDFNTSYRASYTKIGKPGTCLLGQCRHDLVRQRVGDSWLLQAPLLIVHWTELRQRGRCHRNQRAAAVVVVIVVAATTAVGRDMFLRCCRHAACCELTGLQGDRCDLSCH